MSAPSQTEPGDPSVEPTNGEFFAIDRGAWAAVCALGLNPAVSYLVLARFSGLSNATTAASVNAVETYTSISRSRAKAAIDQLCASAIVRKLRGGAHPRYGLLPEGNPGTKRKRPKAGASVVSNWIWLPNLLVTNEGQAGPVELVRSTQDPLLLKLLVDLYDVQNLREDGGIARTVIYRQFLKERITEHDKLVVWGFGKGRLSAVPGPTVLPHVREVTTTERCSGAKVSDYFFGRLQKLVDLGLVEWISYLCESGSAESEPIHPCGRGYSDSIEDKIGEAAHAAGCALLNQEWLAYVLENNLRLVPVPAHQDQVELVGIARMRHRPRTQMTTAWWDDLQITGRKWLERYERIVNERGGQPPATSRDDQGLLKDSPMKIQMISKGSA